MRRDTMSVVGRPNSCRNPVFVVIPPTDKRDDFVLPCLVEKVGVSIRAPGALGTECVPRLRPSPEPISNRQTSRIELGLSHWEQSAIAFSNRQIFETLSLTPFSPFPIIAGFIRGWVPRV